MAHEVKMPKVAMAMNEGTVVEWESDEGEQVTKGDHLLTVETEKVAYDLEAPASGLLHIVTPPGETVPTETLIAMLAEDQAELESLQAGDTGGEPAAPDASPAPARETVSQPAESVSGGRIKASPLAKKIAAREGIDLARVQGTGPGGRIKKRDVMPLIGRQDVGPVMVTAPAVDRPLTERARIPFTGARRKIAEHVVWSLSTAAHVSQATEIDITKLIALRQTFLERSEALGTRVSLLTFFVKALALAAREVPIANARIEGDDIIVYDNVNIGIAVAVPGEHELTSSLLVPVVRNVEAKGLVQIDLEIRNLVERARAGTLSPDDLADGTITLSSAAGFAPGWSATTPVLNNGQALIMQPGTAEEKPVARNGEIVIRTMLPLSLTFDHRILDGEPLGRFYTRFHDSVENPELLLA
ncbi:MAG: dihydrolipoamide acetyltransferase family protein [Gammaproteobacteria bacterium]